MLCSTQILTLVLWLDFNRRMFRYRFRQSSNRSNRSTRSHQPIAEDVEEPAAAAIVSAEDDEDVPPAEGSNKKVDASPNTQ